LVAPLEQRMPDEPLERVDATRKRGRGQSERFRRGLEGAEPRNLDKRLDPG
jgi:hypothetical protein